MDTNFIQFLENRFHAEIRARRTIPPEPGQFAPFPVGLHPKITHVLENQGIQQLFSHQSEAFESISSNRNTVIVSRTASGKTLSFLLPILNEYLNAPSPFAVMLLYPTKALSRDQEGTLGALMQAAANNHTLGTFDGDTPRAERQKLQKSADFIITNPDMLHSGILPNHNRKWRNFLSRLRYVVVDEVHTYRGAFGSHVSNVFRRMSRVCETHGSSPIFVCSSATVGNPREHVETLFHAPFHVISKDGSPRPGRTLYLVNPARSKSHGGAMYRKGTGSVSVKLLREAARLGVRTICFCRARQEVERLYRAVCDNHPGYRSIVQPYRGGLLPNERRRLEKGLFKGEIKAVITTNALELGIDIGDLELCILSGHPGSMASFWQQAGRVGRKGNRAVIVFIAKDVPVDQYMVHHPDYIASSPIEHAWLDADNPYILLQHLPCAAHEHPLRSRETFYDGAVYGEATTALTDQGVLRRFKDTFHYGLSDFPTRGVNLRGMTDYNIEIYCGTEIIGELDPIGARGTLYKDAIYQHLGRRYMSLDLDLQKKLCRVEPVNVDYFTEAVWEKRLGMTETEETAGRFEHRFQFGYIHINKQPKLYKKIRERSFENVGYGPITLPAFEHNTTGFCLLPSRPWRTALDAGDKRFADGAIYGLAYLLRRAAPSLCMGDVRDIGTDVSLAEAGGEKWKSALYIYDSVEGGAGFGEKIFERLEDVLKLCEGIIRECECDAGCPACVPALPPGIENEELAEFLMESNGAVECTKSLLASLLTGKTIVPRVKIIKKAMPPSATRPGENKEMLRLRKRLKKARDLLSQKREKQH